MNFDFSDDQKALRDQARRFLADHASVTRVRAVLDNAERDHDPDLWARVAGMGWLGVAIPEAHGGLGLGRLELCVLAEEMGRALAPIPFSSSLYLFAEAVLAAGSQAQKDQLLPGVVDGSVIGCLATAEGPGALGAGPLSASFAGGTVSGVKIPVTDAMVATHALVLASEGQGTSLVLVDLSGPGVTRERVRTLDPTRGHARLTLNAAPASRVGEAGQGMVLVEATLDRAAVLFAFEQIGGAQRCLEMATAYARDRVAFSRPIGSFQAVKHALADMYVAIEVARSNAYFGAWALSTDAGELPLAAAAARVAACEAFGRAARDNIQVHGGMGFTWDVDCHLFYRRAKLLAVQIGAPQVWKEKLVRRLELRNAA